MLLLLLHLSQLLLGSVPLLLRARSLLLSLMTTEGHHDLRGSRHSPTTDDAHDTVHLNVMSPMWSSDRIRTERS